METCIKTHLINYYIFKYRTDIFYVCHKRKRINKNTISSLKNKIIHCLLKMPLDIYSLSKSMKRK